MSYSLERQYIEQRVLDNISVPVTFDNQEPLEHTGVWARVTINHGDSETAGIGQGVRVRTFGVVTIQFFNKQYTGTNDVLQAVDVAISAFQHQQFNGITCRSATVRRIGERDGVYQTNLTIPFYRDEV